MFDRFTVESRRVMKAARDEAANSDYISTRHLLLGLSQADGNEKVLELLGLTTAVLRAESKKHDVKIKNLRLEIIPFSCNSKKVLEKAVEIAVAQKDNCITPEHLLSGLGLTKGTSAQTVVQSLLTFEELTKKIDDLERAEIVEQEKYQSPFTGEWK